MEEVGEHSGCGSRTGQAFGLEGLELAPAQLLGFGIEQPPERSADAIGGECLLERLRLEEHRKAGERALGNRRCAKRGQGRPEMFLGRGIDGHTLGSKDRMEPFGSPVPLGRLIDPRERLQHDGASPVAGEAGAQVLPVTAAGQRCCPDRAAEIESEDLRAIIAPELQGHQREQHGFAGPGRTDDQRMANIADMKREAERGRALGPGIEQRRRPEVRIPFRPGPDRRERDHVGKVEGRDRRLADIGIDMARQRAEPGLEGVHALDDHGEVAPLDDLLDEAELLGCQCRVLVPDRDSGRNEGHALQVGAQLLQRRIGIGSLVRGIAVEQRRSLVGHHLLEDGGDRLALGKPLAADLAQEFRRIGLVEHDRAGRPAIGEGLAVEFVEDPRERGARETDHGQRAQMGAAKPGLEPAGQRFIGQQRIEVHRGFGNADPMAAGRNTVMEVGERLAVTQPGGFGHEALDQAQQPVGAVDEEFEQFTGLHALPGLAFVEPAFGPRGILGGRHPQQR